MLSKAFDTFLETSPEEAKRTFAEIVERAWDQVRALPFKYTQEVTARVVINADLLIKLTSQVLK